MTIKQTLLKAGRTISKHSPAIFTGLGIGGFGATAYLAYKSKDKVEEITVKIEERRENDLPVDRVEVVKDLSVALYLPITVGALSTASILWGHNIQRKRIVALSGALAAQQAQNLYFEKKYRKTHGDEEFEKFMLPTEEVETEYEDSKGKTKKKIEEVKKETDGTIGEWFSESSEYTNDDHSYNMAYIDSVTEAMQTRLFQRGTLQLNEVREALGFDRIRAGALLGWTSADAFDILTTVTNLGVGDELKEQIRITWTTPKYIYNDVEFNDRYNIY